MPVNERNSKIMRDRRTILGALNMCYPGHLPGEELYMTVISVNPEYTRTFLARDVIYLREKGYALWIGLHGLHQSNWRSHNCAVRLTAAGTDLANQMVTDPVLPV